MISFEMERKLAQAGIIFKDFSEDDNIHTCHKPTFEELWERLPKLIELDSHRMWLELLKCETGNSIIYYYDNHYKFEIYDKDNSKSLSDLAAEMLIELKNMGMM